MNNALKNLNNKYTQITDLIPNKFNFGDEADVWNVDATDFDYFGWANAICIQPDGKVIIGGSSGLNDGTGNYSVIKRFNVNGSLDETFALLKFRGSNGHIRDIKQQSNGKLIVVGHFDEVDGDSYNKIVRLNTDGTVDNSFNVGTGFNSNAFVIKILSDDSVLVGGQFTSYDGTSSSRIAKLGVNGTIDLTFAGNVSLNDQVHAIEVDGNDDIYVGGWFSNRIIRLNEDGTTDGTFNVGSGFNDRVNVIQIQPNGKLIVGGWFNQYDGSNCNPGVARLNTDGTVDNSFESLGTGLNDWDGYSVQDLKIQSDGKIVVGGWFIGYNGTQQGRIIRLNTDGTKDNTFVTGSGFSDRVQRVEINDTGYIFCVGFFYNYNGKNCTSQFNYMNSKYAGGVAKLNPTGNLVGTPLVHDISAFGINDGGNDMWDGGAYFNTDLTNTYENIVSTESVPFTHSTCIVGDSSNDDYVFYKIEANDVDYAGPMDGKIKPGTSYFGSGSSYFTNLYPGLLVLAANKINIDEFSITGGTGQDGDGDFSSGYIELVVKKKQYVAFYKTSYDSSDPVINQLIIVDGLASEITQTLEDGTDSDDHILTGLTGRKELYVLVFGRTDETASTEQELTNIATTFLNLVAVEESVSSCSALICDQPSFKCLTRATNKCSCRRWRLFYPSCSRANIASGLCNGRAGAYVPAITVCNERLF